MSTTYKKISQLIPATDAVGDEPFPMVQGGQTKSGTFALIRAQSLWGLAVSVAANALTIALKKADGVTDPGPGAIWFKFRSSTLTSGAVNIRSVTAALSMVISSGSTLGHFAAKDEYIYVYLIDNAGTLELAVSSSKLFGEGELHTTTAEGGAGAADSKLILYSTAARSNVPVRLVGRIKIQQATPGTWVTAPTEVATEPFGNKITRHSVLVDTGNGHGSTDNKIRRFTNLISSIGTAITRATSAANGDTFTINEDGLYFMKYTDAQNASSGVMGISVNSTQLTTSIATANGRVAYARPASTVPLGLPTVQRLFVGDIVRAHDDGANDFTTAVGSSFEIIKIAD